MRCLSLRRCASSDYRGNPCGQQRSRSGDSSRRCNTRDLARKPIGRVSYYVNQTHYSRIGRSGVYNKFHKPIITSIIDVKKITACGESGFPAGFLN